MMLCKILLLTAATLSTISSVYAADDIKFDENRFDWSGWYLGTHAGYGKGDFDGQYDSSDSAGPFLFSSINADGFVGGIQAGYNWRSEKIIIGFEADFSTTNLTDTGFSPETPIRGPDPVTVDIDYLASFRARLGFSNDRFLIFGTGGVAYTQYELTITEIFPPSETGRENYSDYGYIIGGGLEYMYNENWTLRAEYLHYKFDDSSNLSPITFVDGGDIGDSFGFDSLDVFRVGINRKF